MDGLLESPRPLTLLGEIMKLKTEIASRYVVGLYDPEYCTYSYVSTLGHIRDVNSASTYESTDIALIQFDLKKVQYSQDRFYIKKGLKIMVSKVIVNSVRSKHHTRVMSVRLTKYNHYQKLASLM